MEVVSGRTSTLNPNAPIFVPAAFRQVEDFSQEWWDLVKTSTWFRDYWLSQHQEQDSFNSFSVDEEYDIANLLPDLSDLGIDDEPTLDFQMQEFALFMEDPFESVMSAKGSPRNGLGNEALMRNLEMLKSPKERGMKYVVEPAKLREKAPQFLSPKSTPRRIQQPR